MILGLRRVDSLVIIYLFELFLIEDHFPISHYFTRNLAI